MYLDPDTHVPDDDEETGPQGPTGEGDAAFVEPEDLLYEGDD